MVDAVREQLRSSPNSAKLHARLSGLLLNQAASKMITENEKKSLLRESRSLAEKAIDLRPDRPAGYVALSSVVETLQETIDALNTAVDMHSKSGEAPNHAVVLALVKLLTEPRKREARTLKDTGRRGDRQKNIGKASIKHPNRRDLDERERDIYGRIIKSLDAVEQSFFKQHNALNPTSEWVPRENQRSDFLGSIEYKLGCFFRKLQPEEEHREKSISHFNRVLSVVPPDYIMAKTAQFWLATFPSDAFLGRRSIDTIDRCPEEYIIGLYSTFADNFDELLIKKLRYETPTILRRQVDGAMSTSKRSSTWASRAADLGCGTGLSGAAFRSCVNHMTGVDLSPAMVDKARERNCYDKLVVGDAESILARDESEVEMKYDLIFACDVFCYIGDLRSIFASARRSLNQPDGIFAFSTECLSEEEEASDGRRYVLQPCARFAHSQSYVKALAEEFQFEVRSFKTCPIRKNKGRDVKGILAVLGLP